MQLQPIYTISLTNDPLDLYCKDDFPEPMFYGPETFDISNIKVNRTIRELTDRIRAKVLDSTCVVDYSIEYQLAKSFFYGSDKPSYQLFVNIFHEGKLDSYKFSIKTTEAYL